MASGRDLTHDRYAATPAGHGPGVPHDPAEHALLARCGRFRTLDDHAATVCSALGADATHRPSLRAVLARLARDGFLLAERDVIERISVAPTSGSREPPPAITTLGFVTRDRPRTVARAVASYAGHAAHHGRSVRVVVMDDGAPGPVPDALRSLAPGVDAPIRYAGLGEKRAYVRRLATLSGAPAHVAAFALQDPLGTGMTYGANRNALFLECAGEAFLSADDDTLLRAFHPTGVCRGLAVAGGRPPIDYWFFPDRDAGIRAVPESGEDVLATLEAMLGHSVTALLGKAGERADLERVGTRTLARLLRDPGRVVAVIPGMLGDAGGESPLYHLLSARAESHRAMVATEADYRIAVTSRDHLRAVRVPALSQGGYFMGTAVAFDARDTMPPFLPVYRCEDNLYGDLLRWCRPHDWTGHVPTSLLHSPSEPRRYADPAADEPGGLLPLAAVLALLAQDVDADAPDTAQYQRRLGEHLAGLARSHGLGNVIREKVTRSIDGQLRYVRQCRELHADSPRWWHDDMDRHAAALEALQGAAPVMPRETGTLEATRRVLAAFGELLQWWPDLWCAARELRERGESIAKPLRG